MKVLAVVPARAGSKRIPNKNLCEINGVALWRMAVDMALEITPHVILSTDLPIDLTDEQLPSELEIKQRRAELRGGHVRALAVWQHEFVCAGGVAAGFDATILLQPSTPTRTRTDIRTCLSRLEVFDSACTVSKIPSSHQPGKAVMLTWGKVELLDSLQELRPQYTRDGACFAATPRGLFDFYRDCVGVESSTHQINIDEPVDLEMARCWMSKHPSL